MVGSDLVFTTKGDNRVGRCASGSNTLSVVYDAATFTSPVLTGVAFSPNSTRRYFFIAAQSRGDRASTRPA